MTAATRLLLAYEFRRSASIMPLGSTAAVGQDTGARVSEVFHPFPEGGNMLPSSLGGRGIGALLLLGNPLEDVGVLEVCIVDRVYPRRSWAAPFLHRNDNRSEVHVRLLDVDDRTGYCSLRNRGAVVLCPCHFVCRAGLGYDPRKCVLDAQTLDRYINMRRYLDELRRCVNNSAVSPTTRATP